MPVINTDRTGRRALSIRKTESQVQVPQHLTTDEPQFRNTRHKFKLVTLNNSSSKQATSLKLENMDTSQTLGVPFSGTLPKMSQNYLHSRDRDKSNGTLQQ